MEAVKPVSGWPKALEIFDFSFQFVVFDCLLLELKPGVAVVPEYQVSLGLAPALHLVVERGEDALEQLLEHVHAGVGEHLAFHLQDAFR